MTQKRARFVPRHILVLMLVFVLSIVAAAVAIAQPRDAGRPVKIAILLGSSGRGDKAFTDAALAGLDSAKKHGRLAVVERLPTRPDEYGPTIDQLAADAPDLMIGVGFLYAEPFRAASARHPLARFLLLDVELPGVPNVRSVTFRADEGSFLAGVAAAAESKRGKVGFIGGMEMPILHAFECGYETGVRWAAKELRQTVRGYAVYIGTTPDAFSNPREGAELSRAMITNQGVDVLYAAAGASGLGVIEAAREARIKAIGVDLVLPGRLAPATQKLVEQARAVIVSGRTPACVKEHERPPAWSFPPRSP